MAHTPTFLKTTPTTCVMLKLVLITWNASHRRRLSDDGLPLLQPCRPRLGPVEQTDLGITVTPQSDFAVYYDYVLGANRP